MAREKTRLADFRRRVAAQRTHKELAYCEAPGAPQALFIADAAVLEALIPKHMWAKFPSGASLQEAAIWRVAARLDDSAVLAEVGTVSDLVDVLLSSMVVHAHHPGVQAAVCKCLASLTQDSAVENNVGCKFGAQLVLLALTRFGSTSVALSYYACEALANLSRNARRKVDLVNFGAADALIGALQTHMTARTHPKRAMLLAAACWALGNLCFENLHNTARVLACGAVQPVLAAMWEGAADTECQVGALWALRHLTTASGEVEEQHESIMLMAVEAMRSHPNSEDVHEHAAFVLAHIARTQGGGDIVAAHDAVGRILESAAMYAGNTHTLEALLLFIQAVCVPPSAATALLLRAVRADSILRGIMCHRTCRSVQLHGMRALRTILRAADSLTCDTSVRQRHAIEERQLHARHEAERRNASFDDYEAVEARHARERQNQKVEHFHERQQLSSSNNASSTAYTEVAYTKGLVETAVAVARAAAGDLETKEAALLLVSELTTGQDSPTVRLAGPRPVGIAESWKPHSEVIDDVRQHSRRMLLDQCVLPWLLTTMHGHCDHPGLSGVCARLLHVIIISRDDDTPLDPFVDLMLAMLPANPLFPLARVQVCSTLAVLCTSRRERRRVVKRGGMRTILRMLHRVNLEYMPDAATSALLDAVGHIALEPRYQEELLDQGVVPIVGTAMITYVECVDAQCMALRVLNHLAMTMPKYARAVASAGALAWTLLALDTHTLILRDSGEKAEASKHDPQSGSDVDLQRCRDSRHAGLVAEVPHLAARIANPIFPAGVLPPMEVVVGALALLRPYYGLCSYGLYSMVYIVVACRLMAYIVMAYRCVGAASAYYSS